MRVAEITDQLDRLTQSLTTLSRLYALRLLADRDRLSKLEASGHFAVCMDLAVLIEEFAARHYRRKPALIIWPPNFHPERAGMLQGGAVELTCLAEYIRGLTRHVLDLLALIEDGTAGMLMAAPARALMGQLRVALPRIQGDAVEHPVAVDRGAAPNAPHKALSGPTFVHTDPIFTPTYSLIDEHVPVFGDSLSETVRYLWTVCVGESMAAELCALSAVEYDGLPLAFYHDMGKQAWDEMRHAVGYLDVAVAMLPEVEESLPSGDPLRTAIHRFRKRGTGLPVPRELNLYETIFNCSLEERLILFQIQTEAPGASRKKQNLRSELCRRYNDLAVTLEYDFLDEISHARIGRTWLAHLLPDPNARREAIANTSLLRSVLLLTSFAHHGGGSLSGLLDRYLTAPKLA